MNHHKTNTLRLEFLLAELRGLARDKREYAKHLLATNNNSHIARILKDEANNFEEFLLKTFKQMEQLNWVDVE